MVGRAKSRRLRYLEIFRGWVEVCFPDFRISEKPQKRHFSEKQQKHHLQESTKNTIPVKQ